MMSSRRSRPSLAALLAVVCAVARAVQIQDDPVANFDNVQLWQCNHGYRQQWKIVHDGYPNNNIALTVDGKVLDILEWSNDTGANLQVVAPPLLLKPFSRDQHFTGFLKNKYSLESTVCLQ